jgi:secreted trypsin-like serine protease
MFKKDGRWMIRGIASVSLKNEDGNCDVDNYMVFTDVAKYYKWLQTIL